MVRSRVVDDEARTIASTRYGYDVLGRRTLVQDNGATTLRTLYDGLGFDVVKESPVYSNGGFTDTYDIGIQYEPAGRATGERYRYLDDGATATTEKYQYIEDNAYQTVSSRYSGERTMLYANGSPVAINRSSGTRGYLGTDILGSTRSVTDNHGVQESYYDYDIFGSPITGNYTTGSDYGYLGKPYDKITGLYNYGYRDYSPQSVRFTTVDPIRDGSNWFAYVNNDPVNYVDLLGLLASEPEKTFNIENGIGIAIDVSDTFASVSESIYKTLGKSIIHPVQKNGMTVGYVKVLEDYVVTDKAVISKGVSRGLAVVAGVLGIVDAVNVAKETGGNARGVVRGIRNISSLTAGVFASKIVSTLGTGAVTALSGGVLTVPGAVGAAVVGVAAGVAVSSLVDNGLATVEKWIFSSQE